LAAVEAAKSAAFGVGEGGVIDGEQGFGQAAGEGFGGGYPFPSVLIAVEVPDRN
jgi:hypothetical protein